MSEHSAEMMRRAIDEDELDIAAAALALRQKLARTMEWRAWVRRWPAQAVVGAFVIGFLLGDR